jgi:hypothetical protein
MPTVERVTVGRFQKPAELSIWRRPEHEIERCLSGNFCSISRERPSRSDANHELDFIGESEGLLEQKIGVSLCLTTNKQRRHARLDFEPFLDRGKFYGGGRAETRSAGETPFTRSAEFNYRRRFLLFGLRLFREQKESGHQANYCPAPYHSTPDPSLLPTLPDLHQRVLAMPCASLRSVLLICAFSTACMCRVSTQTTGIRSTR